MQGRRAGDCRSDRRQCAPHVREHEFHRAGVQGYGVTAWTGVIAPAGLPRPILDRLNRTVNAAIADPAVKHHPPRLGEVGGSYPPVRRQDRVIL
jgi:hypothetical protein